MIKDKKLKIGNELIESILDEFSKDIDRHSKIDFDTDCYCCHISWKLGNDPTRPHKKSKIIKIKITEEVLLNAIDDSKNLKQEIQSNFLEFIKTKLKNFDPEHNEPIESPPPIEEWIFQNDLV